MKIILFFFLSISIIAQDSSKSSKINNFDIKEKELLSDSLFKNLQNSKSLLELKNHRIWKSGLTKTQNNEFNGASIIHIEKREQNFLDSDLFWVVLASSMVFGTVAAYFKLEADNSYEKYKISFDQKYKQKTDRYDLYSGIAIGTLQINFGFLIYKLLTD